MNFKTAIALCLTLFSAYAQGANTPPVTKVPFASISYPPVNFVAIQIVTPNGVYLAQLDPTIQLDMTGPVPVLKAVIPAVTLPKPEVSQVFNLTQPTPPTTFTLTSAPAPGSLVKVYRNGLLMASGFDYTVSANVVTFAAGQGTAQGDMVQIIYTPQ